MSTANMLDAMLLRNGGRSTSERRAEESGSTVTLSAPSMLWCHCYHHCPEDSANNTCM